ncbi:hypothetical protein [Sodalis sp. dw_96]|uniref:hypothetical protein n=1 Tax=Sodalis sp. dw_96 TaxID=2719794 RepID=UPI001BD43FBC|nr:hypothetical protein [Sodalis sp. dw_96]
MLDQAQNEGLISSRRAAKETNYPSFCEVPQVELFSCRLSSRWIASLCLDKQTSKLQFSITKAQGTTEVLPFTHLYQIVNAASNGSLTIIQGNTTRGILTLFFSNHYANGEEDSAVQFVGQAADYCLDPTIRYPSTLIQSPQGGLQQSIDIWSLQNYGMAKPFFDRATGRRDETTIWRMWPIKTPKLGKHPINNP